MRSWAPAYEVPSTLAELRQTCPGCGRADLPATEFYVRRQPGGGPPRLSEYCRDCCRQGRAKAGRAEGSPAARVRKRISSGPLRRREALAWVLASRRAPDSPDAPDVFSCCFGDSISGHSRGCLARRTPGRSPEQAEAARNGVT